VLAIQLVAAPADPSGDEPTRGPLDYTGESGPIVGHPSEARYGPAPNVEWSAGSRHILLYCRFVGAAAESVIVMAERMTVRDPRA